MTSKSSRRWLREHFTDPFVKKAQQAGYRSRAVYKLLELQERYHLFKSGMTVIDLGAAPGGFSQLLVEWVLPKGRVIAVDLLPMEAIDQVTFIQGDFTDEAIVNRLLNELGPSKADWVISDMAPNMSGNEQVDIPLAMSLAESALVFAFETLKPTGGFLIKVFQGEGFDAFLKMLRSRFKTVAIRKPKASRDRSRELYIVAQALKA